jgi:hypothetical protein
MSMERPKDYTPEEWAERCARFADPEGDSCLHPATESNPRNLSCPTCKAPDVLTHADKAKGYQCNECADRAEAGMEGY